MKDNKKSEQPMINGIEERRANDEKNNDLALQQPKSERVPLCVARYHANAATHFLYVLFRWIIANWASPIYFVQLSINKIEL